MQSAQDISAAYYFDLAARDESLADGAIELVIEGVPCSVFIDPSQSRELLFPASRIGCDGRITLPTPANSVAICKNIRAGLYGSAGVSARRSRSASTVRALQQQCETRIDLR